MNCKQWFNPNIVKVIDMFSHPVWFVVKNEDRICPCVDITSKTPSPHCKVCLGTGRQVKLTRVYASNQNISNRIRNEVASGEKNIVNVYYTKQKTDIKPGDLVYDHDSIDVVADVYYERSDDHRIVYWRIETVPKKTYHKIFRNLIENTLKEAGYDSDYYNEQKL